MFFFGLLPFLTMYFMGLPFLLTLELVFWGVTVLIVIVPLCTPRVDYANGEDLGNAYTEFNDRNFGKFKARNPFFNIFCAVADDACQDVFTSLEVLPLLDIGIVALGMVLVSFARVH